MRYDLDEVDSMIMSLEQVQPLTIDDVDDMFIDYLNFLPYWTDVVHITSRYEEEVLSGIIWH